MSMACLLASLDIDLLPLFSLICWNCATACNLESSLVASRNAALSLVTLFTKLICFRPRPRIERDAYNKVLRFCGCPAPLSVRRRLTLRSASFKSSWEKKMMSVPEGQMC